MLRLTREQLREIDRRSVEEYHIPSIVLMENAARAATNVALSMLGRIKTAMILCGGGNNGGDGLAIARHLHNAGVETIVELAIDPARYRGDALTNYEIVKSMDILTIPINRGHLSWDIVPALVVDALLGTGLTEMPRSPYSQIIELINQWSPPILAVDLPSGMDCNIGQAPGACVKATRTITFVAEKVGFGNPASKQYTGEITVGGIGCPRELIEKVAKEVK